MKAKTIKSILSKVHNQLVESIEDERVKNLVDKNSIISGGSIVSMLLGEDVNDFDYYFTNKETALEVAKYYLEAFKEKNEKYKNHIVVTNGDRIEFVGPSGRDIVGEYNEEVVLEESILEIEEEKELEKKKFQPVFITSNAISLTNKVQLILRFYGEPEEIHKNYDFVHATNYWRSSDGHLELPQPALEAILAKELRYIGSKYPICSIFRTKKFIQRGWTINAGQYLKMIWQASELDLTNVDVLRDQLVGVDSLYFLQVIEYLKDKKEQMEKEGKDFKVEKSYLFEIVDRIFS